MQAAQWRPCGYLQTYPFSWSATIPGFSFSLGHARKNWTGSEERGKRGGSAGETHTPAISPLSSYGSCADFSPPSLLTLRMAKAGRRGQDTPLPLQVGQEQVYQVAEASPQHFTTLRSSEEAQTGLWLILKPLPQPASPRSDLHPPCWALGQSPHVLPCLGRRVQHRGMGRRCHGGEGGEDANSGKEEPTAEKWTWSLCQGRQRGWSLPGVTPLPMALSGPHFFPLPRVAGAG